MGSFSTKWPSKGDLSYEKCEKSKRRKELKKKKKVNTRWQGLAVYPNKYCQLERDLLVRSSNAQEVGGTPQRPQLRATLEAWPPAYVLSEWYLRLSNTDHIQNVSVVHWKVKGAGLIIQGGLWHVRIRLEDQEEGLQRDALNQISTGRKGHLVHKDDMPQCPLSCSPWN